MSPSYAALAALLLSLAAGCAPELGDSCRVSTDCSVQGDRECDTSAPDGYCTVEDCVEGSCDGEGYCVRFEPDQIRLASAWCMAKCRRGCRNGYRCVGVDDLNAERCGMAVDEYQRLSELPADERCEGVPEGATCPWNDLQDCLVNRPRAAEVLDDAPDARFCGQEPVEMGDLGVPEGASADDDTGE